MAKLADRLKSWAGRLKRDIVALWLAARDPRTPRAAKVVTAIVAAYALSPIDLIPDFIPVLGYLDDLLLVPAGIWLAIRLVPPLLLAELRVEAATREWPRSLAGAGAIVMLWLVSGAALARLWWR